MDRVIDVEMDVYAQLEAALARIASLEKQLAKAEAKSGGAEFWHTPTTLNTSTGTITISTLPVPTAGTYGGIIRSTEPPSWSKKP